MKIAEVLEARGSSIREVARKMEMKPSTLQATIDRNPTISTLRKIAEAAGCQVAEFFADELAEAGFQIVPTSQQPQPAANPAPQGSQRQEGTTGPAANPGMFRCPNCGCGVVLAVTMVQPPTKQQDELPFKGE